MKSIIEQLAEYLASEGIGTLEGSDEGAIFWGTMPAKPDKAICVTAANLGQRGDQDGSHVMIYIRSDEDGNWPLLKSTEIVELLNDLSHVMFVEDGDYIIRVKLVSGPTSGGLSSNATCTYFMGFRIYYC